MAETTSGSSFDIDSQSQSLDQQEHFEVLAKRFGKTHIFQFNTAASLFLFTTDNRIRKAAISLNTSQYFYIFIMTTIFINCICLTMPDKRWIHTAELIFLSIYFLEMVIKVIAKGFFMGKKTYLRDPWNWLDFVIILTGVAAIAVQWLFSGEYLHWLRTVRVLRAVRPISMISGLKTIVKSILRACKMLLEVIALILFCLTVFALFALQMYKGVLHHKCIRKFDPSGSGKGYSYENWIRNSSNWAVNFDGDYLQCGNQSGAWTCDGSYNCINDTGGNPNYGYTNFDHFGSSFLNSFQLLTLDFWEDIYHRITRTMGYGYEIFFLIIVFVGSFYLLNLMLAVVAISYREEAAMAEMRKKKKQEEQKKKRKEALYDLALLTVQNTRTLRLVTLKRDTPSGDTKSPKPQRRITLSGRKSSESKTHLGTIKLSTASPRLSISKPRPNSRRYSVAKQELPETSSPDLSRRPSGVPRDSAVRANSLVPKDSRTAMTGSVRSMRMAARSESRVESVATAASSTPKQSLLKVNSSIANFKSSFRSHFTPPMTALSKKKLRAERKMQKLSLPTVRTPDGEEDIGISDSMDGSAESGSSSDVFANSIIVSVDDLEIKSDDPEGLLVDRNCDCCKQYYSKHYVRFLKLQQGVHLLVTNPLFEYAITLCIFINTIFLAMEHHGQSDVMEETLRTVNEVFTFIFIGEACLKILGLSKQYFQNGWDLFDFGIVIAGIVDIAVEQYQGITVVRTFRLMRVFRIAKSWVTMRILLEITISTIGALVNLTVILGIIVFVFAVIGLDLFRVAYKEYDFNGSEGDRWHFEDFFHSFLMVFRILCGEWVEPLWQCMNVSGAWCMLVFLPTLITGKFIVLNLFLALLLNAFSSENIHKFRLHLADSRIVDPWELLRQICFGRRKSIRPVDESSEEEESHWRSASSRPRSSLSPSRQSADRKARVSLKTPEPVTLSLHAPEITRPSVIMPEPDKASPTPSDDKSFTEASEAGDTHIAVPVRKDTSGGGGMVHISPTAGKASPLSVCDNGEPYQNETSYGEAEPEEEESTPSFNLEEKKKLKEPAECFPHCRSLTCCMAGPIAEKWWTFRSVLLWIVDSQYFENAVLVVIFANSFSLVLDDAHASDNMKQNLFTMDIIFCIFFTLEMVLKWFAYGLTEYFTRFWTILDFMIVMVSAANIIGQKLVGVQRSAIFSLLQALRAFRPLRAVSRWQSLRTVVSSLIHAIPDIFNVFLVVVVFWLVFSIMGVQFFAGKFFKCIDSTGQMLNHTIVSNRSDCLKAGYRWTNSKVNFDNALSGFLALFQLATFEGWMEVMQDTVDSTEVDHQPQFENNLYLGYIYCVVFIIVGSFFSLNLFISVTLDNFLNLRKRYEGAGFLSAFMTPGQRKYYDTFNRLGRRKPEKRVKRPVNRMMSKLYDIATSTRFELGVRLIIIINLFYMALEHYSQPASLEYGLEIMNIIFTSIYGLEALIKILGLRCYYFQDAWNVFDFGVVVASVIDILVGDMLTHSFVNPKLLRVIRVFRVGRILRIVKVMKGLRKLLSALVISLPAICNIGVLLFLIMYIYAVIGISCFKHVKLSGQMDKLINFRTFYRSIQLLIRLATSAGWNDILDPLLITEPDCNFIYKNRTGGLGREWTGYGDCGIPWIAIPYMVSYIIIVYLIVINMYIAVILENYLQAHQEEQGGVTEDDFLMFYVTWERYDPAATQYIPYENLSDFVAELEEPFRIEKPNTARLAHFNLDIVEGDRIHCLDILMALVNHALGALVETEEMKELKAAMEARFIEMFPSRVKETKISTTLQRKREDIAARVLQTAWRIHKMRRNQKVKTASVLRDKIGSAVNKLFNNVGKPAQQNANPP